MASKDKTENIYLKGLITGDNQILREIYSKYSSAIASMVQRHKGTAEDARDVMQEGLIVVYKKAQDKDFKLTGSFLSFFYAVCRNIWLKTLSNRKLSRVTIEDTLELIDEASVEQAMVTRERHQLYLKKLKELSASCQQILQLHIQGKKIKEIVKIMGFSSEGYARKRKHNCKEKLLNRVKQDALFLELL